MSLSDLADSLIPGVKLDDSPVALPPIRFFWQRIVVPALAG